MEEQHGRRRNEEISVLLWFFRNNSVLPSSTRSFRTQSYWSFITGQCHYSRRFLQVLTRQDKKFFTSELFKVIQDAIPLILHCRTMCSFRTISSSTFYYFGCPISLHSIKNSGLIPGGQKLSNRQTVFFLPVNPMDKDHRDPDTIDLEAPRLAQYMHKAWKKHQNTVYWVDINPLLWRKDWSSIRHDRTLSFFTKHSQLIVSRKVFGWKLEKSCRRRYMCHLGLLQRFPWNMIGWRNWVQKLLDNQKQKLLDKQKVPNRANQIQTQIMIERWNLLFALKEERSILRKSKHVLFVKKMQIMQYSLNKDHQHHKWRRQKSWISFPDCRVAQDKWRTQYLLIPRSKWKMLTNCSEFPNRNVQTFGFVYHDTNGQNHGPVRKTQSFLLSAISMVILQQDYYGKGNLRKSYCSTVGRRFPIDNAVSYTVKKGLIWSVYVDDIKLAGKKQNIDPVWKLLNKEVDLGEPTSFLDHVLLGCTQRQCEISKDIADNCTTMCESRISAGATEKLPYSEHLSISSWSYDMPQQDHFKEEELKSVGELSKVCSQIVLECLYLARIGRPDILWSVNKLARSITKWTKACDKRLFRLISYMHHTSDYKQYCHVGNTAKQCRLGLFQDSDFAADLVDSQSTSSGTLRFRKPYVCSNQLDV